MNKYIVTFFVLVFFGLCIACAIDKHLSVSPGVIKAQGGPNPFTQIENADTQEQCIVGALSVGKDANHVASLNRACLVHNGQAF